MAESEKVVLLIGLSSSSCSRCDQNALPGDQTHSRAPSWSDTKRQGCGARFTHIQALYTGIPTERLQEMRPDLEVIDLSAPPDSLGAAPTIHNPPPGEHTNSGVR